jgi:hypothetical protein
MGAFTMGTTRDKKELQMTANQRLLLETLAAHFAWLKAAHPRKANAALAKRAQRAVNHSLRVASSSRLRKAA